MPPELPAATWVKQVASPLYIVRFGNKYGHVLACPRGWNALYDGRWLGRCDLRADAAALVEEAASQ